MIQVEIYHLLKNMNMINWEDASTEFVMMATGILCKDMSMNWMIMVIP